MKKMLFILNPISGQKRAARHLADIVALYNRAGFEVITYVTGEQGDATRMAEEKCNEVDLIVCCGGDGTYNETISGLQRAGSKVPVGYIPAGSTNDLATRIPGFALPCSAAPAGCRMPCCPGRSKWWI